MRMFFFFRAEEPKDELVCSTRSCATWRVWWLHESVGVGDDAQTRAVYDVDQYSSSMIVQ